MRFRLLLLFVSVFASILCTSSCLAQDFSALDIYKDFLCGQIEIKYKQTQLLLDKLDEVFFLGDSQVGMTTPSDGSRISMLIMGVEYNIKRSGTTFLLDILFKSKRYAKNFHNSIGFVLFRDTSFNGVYFISPDKKIYKPVFKARRIEVRSKHKIIYRLRFTVVGSLTTSSCM